MNNQSAVSRALLRLSNGREKRDFTQQLAAYKELALLSETNGTLNETVDYLEKAAKVSEYLKHQIDTGQLFNALLRIDEDAGDLDAIEKAARVSEYRKYHIETDELFNSLLRINEDAGDLDAIIEIYGRLHLHWNLYGDFEKGAAYNERRLIIVARQIGKESPTLNERLSFEVEHSRRVGQRVEARYHRLISGKEAPTVRDEHVEACDYLTKMYSLHGKNSKAFEVACSCEQTMRTLGWWASPQGIEQVRDLKNSFNNGHEQTINNEHPKDEQPKGGLFQTFIRWVRDVTRER